MHRNISTALLLVALHFEINSSSAAPVVFRIDPAQSSITISGSVAGNNIKEQGGGSLSTSFSGFLNANLEASTIQFTGGSELDAQTNGVWEPKPGGQAGTAPADYGAMANTFIGTVKAAFRNLLLDLTSGPLAVSNGSFDSLGLTFSFPTNSSASFDYTAGFLGSGSRSLSGFSTNRVVNGASLVSAGESQTLIIKIDTEFRFKALADNDSNARLLGQIVATRGMQPVITSIGFTNQTVTIRAEGSAGQPYKLQSTRDLVNWAPRTADVTNQSGSYTFTAKTTDSTEFFRLTK